MDFEPGRLPEGLPAFTPDQAEFYAALGWAIAQWALVEQSCSELFRRLLGGRVYGVAMRQRPAEAAFFAAIGFQTKLSILSATAEEVLHESDLAQWKKLCKRLGAGAKRRNHFAHFQPLNDRRAMRLVAPIADPRSARRFPDLRYFYTTADLARHGRRFHALSLQVSLFVAHLERQGTPPPMPS